MPEAATPNSTVKPDVSLVIPCYNEAKRVHILTAALKELEQHHTFNFEVLVVDDGSTDSTVSQLQGDAFLNELQEKGKFKLIVSAGNGGKGAALRQGVLAANGNYILTLDADMSTHPLQLEQWRDSLGGAFNPQEILIGSRPHPESRLQEKPSRKFIGIIFNFYVRLFTELTVKDSQCGFKLYPADAAKQLFGGMQVMGWAHDVEILYKAQLLGYKITEMPVVWDVRDNSKVSVIRDSIKMFIQILKISLYIRFTWKKEMYGNR